jgi:Transposase DDE domain
MRVQAVAIRVHWATGSSLHSTSHSRVHTGPEGWLLAERPVPETAADDPQSTQAAPQEKEEEKIKYWFSVLPASTSLERLVLLAHARWVIEQFYEDAKQECGLDHFQGRSWDGLHRHLALVMLAYSFLMLQRLTLPLPPSEAFPPLRHAKLAAWSASPSAALAVPGSRALAAPHPAGRVLPPPEETTKVVLGDTELGPGQQEGDTSVYDSLKRTDIAYVKAEGSPTLSQTMQMLTESEGFPAHASAVQDRPIFYFPARVIMAFSVSISPICPQLPRKTICSSCCFVREDPGYNGCCNGSEDGRECKNVSRTSHTWSKYTSRS